MDTRKGEGIAISNLAWIRPGEVNLPKIELAFRKLDGVEVISPAQIETLEADKIYGISRPDIYLEPGEEVAFRITRSFRFGHALSFHIRAPRRFNITLDNFLRRRYPEPAPH